MRYTICTLKLKSSFHAGEREQWLEGSDTFIHSDTLFSALCNACLLMYGACELSDMLEMFNADSPPFLLSSAFPCWNGEYYFPVPLNQQSGAKKIKRIEFVASGGLARLLNGDSLQTIINTTTVIPSLKSNAEDAFPWVLENTPRVGLSRFSNHPGENYFHFGQVFYRENAGLFFMIDIKNPEYEKKIISTIRLMADEGIGGDRTCGKGHMYQPVFSQLDVPDIPNADGVYMVSLYFPEESALQSINNSYYTLIERKGYIYSPAGKSMRRKSVRLFSEGSVFPGATNHKGMLVNVKPDAFISHDVFRYGIAFGLPCRLEVNNS